MIRALPGTAGVSIGVKVVPGAKRDEVVGVLGDRLKVRVAAPPEGGKANAAVCRVVARMLGVSAGRVEVTTGHGRAEKTVAVAGVEAESVRAAIGMLGRK